MASASSGSGSITRGSSIGRFLGWWLAELRELVPVRLAPGRSGARKFRRPSLVLSAGPGRHRLFDEQNGRMRELDASPVTQDRDAAIEARLAAISSEDPRPAIVLRLPREFLFSRTAQLPAGAARDMVRILELDLEQATPFRRRDCLTAHRLVPNEAGKSAPPGRILAEQLVLKRATLEEVLKPLRRAGLEPARVDCWANSGPDAASGPALDVDFLDADRVGSGMAAESSMTRPLAISAAALAAAAIAIGITRLEGAAGEIEQRAAASRARFASVEVARRDAATGQARIAALLEMKSKEVSRAAVIDALTRLLPDTDYLTSLKIDGASIEISGYSASTAALVPLVERSKAFARATLTSPVTFDERAGRERFSLRAEIVSELGGDAAPGGGG